jgi:hypothetical protein
MDVRTPISPLLTLDEVRQRLAALRVELNRLARDQTVFARAFHTQVAQTVYAALIEDEARLAEVETLDLALEDSPEITLSSPVCEGQPWSASGPARRCEILEV